MGSKQDEKHLKLLRGLLQLPENKRCADCLAKGPVYVNTTFNTFVCTTCSGIHREFAFRVKSISMASFKPDEVKGLQDGGNKNAREQWMARWNADEYPEPEAGDLERIRQFIRLKYVEKKWIERGTPKKSTAKVEPLSNILGSDLPPMKVERMNQQPASQSQSQSQQPQYSQGQGQGNANVAVTQPQRQSSGGQINQQGFANFANFESPRQQPQMQPQPQQPKPGGLDDLLFPSQEEIIKRQEEEMKRQQEQAKQQRANQLQQQIGQLYQQTAMQQSLAMQQMFMQQQQMLIQQQQQRAQAMGMPGQVQIQGAQGIPVGMMMAPGVQMTPGMQVTPGVMPMQSAVNPWGVAAPVAVAPVAIPIPVVEEKKEPPKPDPFASLSPFALSMNNMNSGKPMTSSAKPMQSSSTSDLMDFGLGPSPTPTTTAAQTTDLNPFF